MTENNTTPSTSTTPAAGIDSGEGDLFRIVETNIGVPTFVGVCGDCDWDSGLPNTHRATVVTDCQAHGQQAHGWSLGVVAGVGVTAARGGHPNAAQTPPDANNTDLGDGADVEPERERFVPGYAVSDRRILRARLAVSATDGTATVTFRGQVANGLDCWVEQGTSGRLSLYAEVAVDDTTATSITVAVVPTGKRAPDTGARLGSVGGKHVYLLSIDGSVDRAELDADFEARKAAKAEARAAAQAAQAAQVGNPFGFGGF